MTKVPRLKIFYREQLKSEGFKQKKFVSYFKRKIYFKKKLVYEFRDISLL